ncbi:MAG: hypothetical protein LC656_03950 [Sphingomonadales bacterium]|nr:hypothetical protein [Sphingomonadales bacterium]
MLIFLFAAVASATSAPLPADVSPPSSQWQVDYGDSRCLAVRSYATPNGDVAIAFIPAPTFGATQISMVRKGGSSRPLQQDVTLEGPGGAVKSTLIDYPSTKGHSMVSRVTLTPAEYKIA